MTKRAPRRPRAVATSLVLSIAGVAILAFPAVGLAAGGPLLDFSPASVGFAKTTVGAESPAQAVDVHNVGDATAAIDQVVVAGADSVDFKITGGNCGSLTPDQHCSLGVAFAPGSAGAKTATLAVKLKEAPEQTAQLEGEAVPAQLGFTPDAYDFGIQHVNRGESSAYLQLVNTGEAATQLNNMGVGGANPANFWVNGGDCSNGRWLQPGESCGTQVGFNPWDTVPYAAELQAHVNGATFSAALSGVGGRAALEPSSDPFDFGTVPVGSAGPVETIVLTNNGNMAGGFFIAVIAGGSVGSFQLIDEDCTGVPLDPGTTCTVRVRFAPQEIGPKAARLALFGDDDGGPMMMLRGKGVEPLPSAAAPGPAEPAGVTPDAPGRHRRFDRGAALSAGRARCRSVKPCRRSRALRPGTIVAGG
jgi:hypothetical protein